jgi:subfamily B ATP-binding cassette protein MsbA
MSPPGRQRDLSRFAFLVARYVRPYGRSVALLLAGSLVVTALAALGPFIMAPIFDLAFDRRPAAPAGGGLWGVSLANLSAVVFSWLGFGQGGDRFTLIVLFCAAYVGIGWLKSLGEFLNFLVAMRIRVRAALDMTQDLFRHTLGLSLGFFTRQRTGDLVSRLYSDTHTATVGLEGIVTTLLTAPLLILFYGFLLVRTSPLLVVAAVAAAALHWAVSRGIQRRIRRASEEHWRIYGDIAARLQEAFLSIRVVKSFGAEAVELAKLAREAAGAFRAHLRFAGVKNVEGPARGGINYFVEGSLVVLAAWELMAGRMSAPTFLLFLYVGRAVMVPIGQLGAAWTQIQATLGASARLFELLEERPEIVDGPEAVGGFGDRIRLEHVSFAYGGAPVLADVGFEIRRGETVALVGPSGVGKSTLADLVLRLYDPVSGRITIDGRDLRSLRQRDYRRLFGVVSQEALLFNTTVRENIAYGLPDASDEDIARAARIANAHDFIRELPQGYDTVVGDRGIRLSGGQRQRIAIARAIVGRPPILVLDEATSALDTESEKAVQEAIDRIIHETTSIIIAHRLSTVLHADQIVVLAEGRVESVGRHETLLRESPTYARLYRLQFEGIAST